jgi:hypothetical protein
MIEWTRVRAGSHYDHVVYGRKYDTGKVFRIDVVNSRGCWHLKINGVFRGSFATARAAKERAQHLVDTNDFSLNKIGD